MHPQAGYFAISFFRETTQLGIALGIKPLGEGLKDYFFDFWNLLDLSSLVFFFFGLFLRSKCIEGDGQCDWSEVCSPTSSIQYFE